jgi:hypothetical protein
MHDSRRVKLISTVTQFEFGQPNQNRKKESAFKEITVNYSPNGFIKLWGEKETCVSSSIE